MSPDLVTCCLRFAGTKNQVRLGQSTVALLIGRGTMMHENAKLVLKLIQTANVAVGVAERSGVNLASILQKACNLLVTADRFRERGMFDEVDAAEIEHVRDQVRQRIDALLPRVRV